LSLLPKPHRYTVDVIVWLNHIRKQDPHTAHFNKINVSNSDIGSKTNLCT